jgi:XapX domain-containing protein
MKMYVLSLAAGLLVGVIYSLLGIRSPAPPLVALVGLLGILLGEQIVPVAGQIVTGNDLASAWREAGCAPRLFGLLPARNATERTSADVAEKAS